MIDNKFLLREKVRPADKSHSGRDTGKKLMNEVKVEVRRLALAWEEFCVDDIIAVTGFNRSSVHTEINRMKKDGFIPKNRLSQEGERKYYRLIDDPDKRAELAKSVQGFPSQIFTTDYPSSPSYWSAQKKITSAHNIHGPELIHLLDEAENDLEKAWNDEGGPALDEKIKAFIKFEKARILYLKPKELSQAKEYFLELNGQFLEEYEENQRALLEEYLTCIDLKMCYKNSRIPLQVLLRSFQEKKIQPHSPAFYLLVERGIPKSIETGGAKDPVPGPDPKPNNVIYLRSEKFGKSEVSRGLLDGLISLRQEHEHKIFG
jgi:hypothetical protein